MHFRHAPEIWEAFPQLVPGLLVVDQIDAQADTRQALEPWLDQARDRLAAAGTESQLPEISAWQQAYSQMGFKPTKYRSAGEALLRRFRKEDSLPTLHPLVDFCNAVSVAFAMPIAVFDLAHVAEYLAVRHATGTETHLAFNGDIETPPEGEVIFADAENHAHARRWTFRQSKRSVIRPETERVLIVSEALHETAADDVPRLIDVLADAVTEFWAVPKYKAVLTADDPKFTFEI